MKKMISTLCKKRTLVIVLPLLFLVFTMCITISGVMQPSTATIGEEINITVDVAVIPAEDASHNIIFGVLAPESWDIASNAVASYTSDNGDGTMRLATAADPDYSFQMMDLVGIGKNYGLVKWVVFISDDAITGANAVGFSGQIQLGLTVGDENINTQMGYVVGTSGWGITAGNIGTNFTPCMEVSGGTNALIDLCGPLPFPVTYEPTEYTLDDIIHITFDATKGSQGSPTALLGVDQVYLCGTVTANGATTQVCDTNATTMLRRIGTDLWEISIWAKQFFGLPPDADISDISFNFTNEAGDIIVKDPDTGEDFQIIPNCTN